jgi:predicted DNA-binding transcriptional regulator YafY
MRASRLLSILIILQLRGRATAEVLAGEFEVSIRTIYRDIDQLSAAGVPVYAERGRAGGFALLDGYRTKLTGLTPAEAQALLLAGAGGAAADLGVGPEAAAAQLKLLASLPPDAGASAQHVASRFHLDPVQWYARTEPLEILPQLATAVWRDRRIRIRYESWKDTVRRDADPLGLVLKGGVWYLVAAVKESSGKPSKDPRTYRVSNILSLEVLDASFKRPSRFSLARHWDKWTTDFETRLISETATVRISRAGLRLLRDAHPAAWGAARENGRPAKPEGWLKADIPVEAISSSSRQLLRLGAEIEVLSPPELRAAIAKEAATVSAIYAKRKAYGRIP